MIDLATLHAIAGVALPLVAVVAAFRAEAPERRRIAVAAALLATFTLASGLLRQRGWEPGYRRAVYLLSRAAGEWLDRKTHFGFAACCFALGAAVASFDRAPPARVLRGLWILAAAFALAALLVLVYVHARVPDALVS